MSIHNTAIVDRTAEIDATAEVGAYSIIEGGVKIAADTRVYPHAYIGCGTTIGARCQIHPFATVGQPPQDLAFKNEPSYTVIGDETIIREHVSVHRGTMPGSTTRVGARCFLMACSHVAHNCVLGDDVKMANGALLAGHVQVGDKAFIAGNTAIHQFVRVGELAMISGVRVSNDVVPFMIMGPMGIVGPNVVGLRRSGFSAEERLEVREIYRQLFRTRASFRAATDEVEKTVKTAAGRKLLEFIRGASKRGFVGYRGKRSSVIEGVE